MIGRFAIIITAATLCLTSPAKALSSCDLVLHWDERTLSSCIEELQKKIEQQQWTINNIEGEKRNLESFICLMAQEFKQRIPTADLALIIESSCADLRARAAAKKRSPKPAK